ncbi:uncharacterized protein TRIVIDRAFT_65470 [Trichoderma virens Gv29-8]|uniref:Uncharacterized protein n=1 Tax=Hypocrea virens (strain Gv29-8 / FGSC 10586) TaxID=413071 RepID=G9NA16_HYPVG|nr:uncharacterized protein TRIVIDRAFT_65470 [Trichoderma virens Gv29-8]EHK16783.1 hypothetical protein TRIVIDRAFT_65470 [Trichoderma virens Gv29-8]UKZ51841.1 hypothetical protein TrVGV298_005605 [Trichoderma virens]
MTARNPWRPGDGQACFDHLLWKQQRGPFISFFTSWRAALEGLPLVYDALSIAQSLRLGRLHLFQDEVLVYGGISADSYRIRAIFHGNEKMVDATLSVYGIDVTVQMPGGFVDEVSTKMHVGTQRLPDATDALRDEIYMCTGTLDDDKLCGLALSMGGIARRW